MATSLTFAPISGGLKKPEVSFSKCSNSGKMNGNLMMMMKPNRMGVNRKLAVRAQYSNNKGGGGADFLVGFFLGGAICGTVAYIYGPQVRRYLRNENEHGFVIPREPPYYQYYAQEEDALQKTRQILHDKLDQLNSAIENVSSRLLGRNKVPEPPVPVDRDPPIYPGV